MPRAALNEAGPLKAKIGTTLEYIVVHEMTHLLERGHGERFTKLMDGSLSDWRSRRDELNSAPLADERWADATDSKHGNQGLSR